MIPDLDRGIGVRAFWWGHKKGKSMEAGGRESKMQEMGENSRQ